MLDELCWMSHLDVNIDTNTNMNTNTDRNKTYTANDKNSKHKCHYMNNSEYECTDKPKHEENYEYNCQHTCKHQQ